MSDARTSGPPPSTVQEDEQGFLGGFDDSFTFETPTSARVDAGGGPSVFGLQFPTVTPPGSIQATLGDLRDLGAGGYISADQWLPVNEDPKVIAQLQISLAEAGLLDLSDLDHDDLGFYDDATRNAYRDLLTRANAMHTSWDVALGRLRSNPVAASRKPERGTVEALPVVTHPDDLKAIFRAGARRAIGSGKIDDAELDRMVKAFQRMQVQTQTQTTGTQVVRPPDPEVFADQQAQRLDPAAYDAHKFLDRFSVVAEALGGQ